MPNMAAIIKQHNSNVASPRKTDETKLAENCNCQNKSNCPLNGNCLKSCLIYKATISSGNQQDLLLRIVLNCFQKRFNNHSSSFRHQRLEKSTDYQNEFGSTKIKAAIIKSNGVSLKKLLHIAVVQKYAAFVWQKSCKSSKRNQKDC